MTQLRVCFRVLLLLGLSGTLASAQQWSRFRGPNGGGLSDSTLPARWTEKDYLWKVELPGLGHSSPVLWGERLFVTSSEKETGKRLLLCLDAGTGRTLWSKELAGGTYRTHRRNSFASSTPAASAEHVYAAWGTPAKLSIHAFTHAGELAWQTDFPGYRSQHGFGVSPTVWEDLLVLPNEMDGGGSLLALDRHTGKVRWNIPRQGKNATYSTPCVHEPPGRPAEILFTNWQHGITAVDPRAGKVTWEISVFEVDRPERAIASPVLAGDLVLGTCGYVTAQKHLVAVRPGNPAQEVKPREVWRLERAVAYLPTPLARGEHVYLCSEQGIVTCLEAKTGKVVWQERLDGTFSASPVCAGSSLYCVSDSGDVFVLRAAPEYQLLGRSSLGDPSQSTPAIAGERIFFRTERYLLAIGK